MSALLGGGGDRGGDGEAGGDLEWGAGGPWEGGSSDIGTTKGKEAAAIRELGWAIPDETRDAGSMPISMTQTRACKTLPVAVNSTVKLHDRCNAVLDPTAVYRSEQ